MYGKTILKPIETETVVKIEQDFLEYVSFNYNIYKQVLKSVIGITLMKLKPFLIILTMSIAVLSTSKRIMNEVMTLAEDKGLSIWYQDTDSMHINYEDVETLAAAFQT